MRFTSTYFISAILAGVCTTTTLSAQQVRPTAADIDYIRNSNAWLSSRNAAGLTHYNTGNVSNAEIFFNKQDGNFRNYFQSDDAREYGVRAGSYTRLNQHVVLAGSFDYHNFRGKNMSGSAFIDPYQAPFDIVELDAANKGSKELEHYQLNGAVGGQVTSRLSIGGRLNYGTANYAKRKDLRHTNKLLSMDLSVGALYRLSDVVDVGANYNYDRRIESLSFRTFGNTDRQYLSLISFGSFYGRTELFSDYGYTADQSTNPLKDSRQGASVQLNVHLNKSITLFNEFTYEDRKGFFGEEGTTSILLTRHNGTGFMYNGQLTVKAMDKEHHIRLNGDYDYLDNRETIYRRQTTPGGINEIRYYGDREAFYGQSLKAGLSYDLYIRVQNDRPTWAVNLTADYLHRDQSTQFYPFYRDQKIDSYQISGQINRHYNRQKDAFNVGLGLGFGTGSGEMFIDGTAATPATDYIPPATMIQFMGEEYEFLTADRIKGNVELQYTRALKNNLAVYLKVNYGHIYAGDVNYLGKHFNQTQVSLGCNF